MMLTEAWGALLRNSTPSVSIIVSPRNKPSTSSLSLSCGCGGRRRAYNNKSPNYVATKRSSNHNFAVVNCCHNQNQEDEQGPPQEAVLKAISELSKTEGRVGLTTNVVIGGTDTDDATNEWLTLDQKVNSYPTVSGFTAIGTGGEDFVQAMVVAVESVLQKPIPEGKVKLKVSSGGNYVSVNIGPVQVASSEQVQAVYNAMRRDERMKYFL